MNWRHSEQQPQSPSDSPSSWNTRRQTNSHNLLSIDQSDSNSESVPYNNTTALKNLSKKTNNERQSDFSNWGRNNGYYQQHSSQGQQDYSQEVLRKSKAYLDICSYDFPSSVNKGNPERNPPLNSFLDPSAEHIQANSRGKHLTKHMRQELTRGYNASTNRMMDVNARQTNQSDNSCEYEQNPRQKNQGAQVSWNQQGWGARRTNSRQSQESHNDTNLKKIRTRSRPNDKEMRLGQLKQTQRQVQETRQVNKKPQEGSKGHEKRSQTLIQFNDLLGKLTTYANEKMTNMVLQGVQSSDIDSIEKIMRFVRDQNLDI